MSTLNLVPWRERQRLAVFRRWQVGVVLGAIATTLKVGVVLGAIATTLTLMAIEQALGNINQAHEARLEALHAQQQALQQQLT
ncbi:MAG: hypothetical protein RL763_1092, partial [Pseudomonadota bacterium]